MRWVLGAEVNRPFCRGRIVRVLVELHNAGKAFLYYISASFWHIVHCNMDVSYQLLASLASHQTGESLL